MPSINTTAGASQRVDKKASKRQGNQGSPVDKNKKARSAAEYEDVIMEEDLDYAHEEVVSTQTEEDVTQKSAQRMKKASTKKQPIDLDTFPVSFDGILAVIDETIQQQAFIMDVTNGASKGKMSDAQKNLISGKAERSIKFLNKMRDMVAVVRDNCQQDAHMSQHASQPMSYAQAAARSTNSTIEQPKFQKRHQIFCKGKNGETAKELKAAITKNVNPLEAKIGFKAVREISDKTVLIEVVHQDQIERLEKEIGLRKELGFIKTEKPARRKPLMYIPDVPEHVVKEELIRYLQVQNNLPISDSQDISIAFTRKPKNGSYFAVLRVNAKIRQAIFQQQGRVAIDRSYLRCKDFSPVKQCYRCQSFGHLQKFCVSDRDVCPKCSENHRENECKSQSGQMCCPNCKAHNEKLKDSRRLAYPVNHSARDESKCPVFQHVSARERAKVDYDE